MDGLLTVAVCEAEQSLNVNCISPIELQPCISFLQLAVCLWMLYT
jgi:hypothetical protein